MPTEAKKHVWGEIDDDVVRSSLHELDRRLKAKFGERYAKLILFGSRARGDHKPDSDADVAVVMRDPIENWWPLTQSVLEETYEILLDTGLDVQPHVIDEATLKAPASARNPELAREILKDGYTP